MHGSLQAGYNGGLAPLCIGSHYAVRTAALRQIGGLGPELAEDHSTTLMMNAFGWRGVHALDAIASGDGPRTFADLVTQEFQWSRSLVTLLLQYSPKYVPNLPFRLKFQFLFSQLWYPLFSFFMALMFVMPIFALMRGESFADVTYAGFLAPFCAAFDDCCSDGLSLAGKRFVQAVRRENSELGGGAFSVRALALGFGRNRRGGARLADRFLCRFPHNAEGQLRRSIRFRFGLSLPTSFCRSPPSCRYCSSTMRARPRGLLHLRNHQRALYAVLTLVIIVQHARENDVRASSRSYRPAMAAGLFSLFVLPGIALAERGMNGVESLAWGAGHLSLFEYQLLVGWGRNS